MDYTFLLLFLAIVLAVSTTYMTVVFLRKWEFVLSAKETAIFGLIMFSIGWVFEAYLAGSGIGVLEGSIVDFLFFGWYLYRWNDLRIQKKIRKELGVQ